MKKSLPYAIVFLCIHALPVQAADRDWNNTGTNFNAPGSWTQNAIPGSSDKVWFRAAATTSPNVSSNTTVQGLMFAPTDAQADAPTAGGSGYNLSSSEGVTLELTNTGTFAGGRAIYMNIIGTSEISANLVFNNASTQHTIQIANGILNISGDISGLGGIALSSNLVNTSSLTLSGNNTFQGGFSHNSRQIVNVGSTNAFGSGKFTWGNHGGVVGNEAVVNNNSGGTLTVSSLEIRGNNRLGVGDMTVTGVTTLAGNANTTYRFHVDGTNRLTLNGSVVLDDNLQNRGIDKRGTGVLALNAASSYGGTTFLTEGVMLLNHSSALGTGNLRIRSESGSPQTGGVLGLATGDFTRGLGNGVGQVEWNDTGGFTSSGGFAAYGADRTVNLGGAAAGVTWGSGGFVGSVFVLGAADANKTINFQNGINLNSNTRRFHVVEGLDAGISTAKINGVVSNGSVDVTGTGTLEFTQANTYTGRTRVQNTATLLINGTHIETANVTGNGYNSTTDGHFLVADGATLGGAGRIAGFNNQANSNMILVQDGGSIAPGASIGILTLDGGNMSHSSSRVLNMASGAEFVFELSGNSASSDEIHFWNYVSGDFLLNNNKIHLSLLGLQQAGTRTVQLFSFFSDNGLTPFNSGITTGLEIGDLGSGIQSASLNYNAGGSTISLTYTVIPEPSSALLLLFSLGILVRRRRKY